MMTFTRFHSSFATKDKLTKYFVSLSFVAKELWITAIMCKLMTKHLKFMYFEKTTQFCEISTVDLTGTKYIGQIYSGDFAKCYGLLKIYEL